MDRRDFLDPRHLAQSAGHILGAASLTSDADVPAATADQDMTLVRYSRRAMGTAFEVVLPFGHRLPTQSVHDTFDLIDALESQLSVYREASDVSALNRRAYLEDVIVEHGLFALLERSLSLSRATDGAFDITAGALVQAWGFFKGPRRVPSDDERLAALAQSGWRYLVLNESSSSVRFTVNGLQINLGSIGKGHALDRAAELLHTQWDGPDVLMHGGKSSVVGIGHPPGEPRGWLINLEHPWDPHRPLAGVYLRDRAMATSAATYKHLVHDGKKLGHILDPRTGWPARGIASATAISPNAAEADALATAFYILGVEQTEKLCREHPHVGAILLRDGSTEPILLNVNGPGQPVVVQSSGA